MNPGIEPLTEVAWVWSEFWSAELSDMEEMRGKKLGGDDIY
jgi:hypothetical protein